MSFLRVIPSLGWMQKQSLQKWIRINRLNHWQSHERRKMAQLFFILLFICSASSALAKESNLIILEDNYQRPGGDYTSVRTASARECAQKCEKSRRCKAFDYYKSDNSCWLKSKAYPARSYAGVISGFKRSDYPEDLSGTASTTMDFSYDTQRPGSDYTWFQAQNAQQCAQKCIKDRKCVAFDYSTLDNFCYLKSWVPSARKQKGIISGLKKRFYPQVKAVQELLTKQNYSPGIADGLMGRNTRIALKNYQGDHHLLVTGRIDDTTLTALGLRSSTERAPQVPSAESQGRDTSEKYAKENILLHIETVSVTYLQLADDIYAKVLAKIPANTVLQVLSQNDEWYKVSYLNQAGFILAESVKVNPEPKQHTSHEEAFVSPASGIFIEEEFAQ